MSEQPATGSLPKWDLADRMRKSLRHAGLGVSDMADYLDVSRTTVSNWVNGRIYPSMATQRLWALRTGVPFTWLHHGDMQPCDLRQVEVSAVQSAHGPKSNKMHCMPTNEVA